MRLSPLRRGIATESEPLSISRGDAAGQANAERRAIGLRRRCGTRTAVRSGDLLRDEESEPEPMRPRGMRRPTLAEGIEDEGKRFCRNALAAIGDLDDDFGLPAVDTQIDGGSRLAVLDGIDDEIAEQLVHPIAI